MSLSKTSGSRTRTESARSTASQHDAQAWRELALDSLLSGEPESGLWFLRNAIEADSDDAETWQLMGRCFEEMGEESRARKCFLLALRQHAASGAPTQANPPATLSLFWRRRPSREVQS